MPFQPCSGRPGWLGRCWDPAGEVPHQRAPRLGPLERSQPGGSSFVPKALQQVPSLGLLGSFQMDLWPYKWWITVYNKEQEQIWVVSNLIITRVTQSFSDMWFQCLQTLKTCLEHLTGKAALYTALLPTQLCTDLAHTSSTPQNFRKIVEGLSEPPGLGEGCAEDLYLHFPLFEGCSSGQLWKTSVSVLINDLFKHSSWRCLKPSSLAPRTLEECRVSWWALKTGPL